MSATKIEVVLGPVSFTGEGDQVWLAEQLERVLKAAPGVLGAHQPSSVAPSPSVVGATPASNSEVAFTTSLDISRYRVETRTALPFECPFIEVSNLDERAGNAEAKLYRKS